MTSSFTDFCDEMVIANESKNKTPVSEGSAKVVSSIQQMKTAVAQQVPLIKLTGSAEQKIRDAFNEYTQKNKRGTTYIVLGLFVLWPLLIPGIINKVETQNIRKYGVHYSKNGSYLLHRDYYILK